MALDDPKYSCACGSRHVRQGSIIVAWIIIGISIIWIIGSFFTLGWYNIFPIIIIICSSGLVIYADRQEKSWMYMPFLVLEGIETVMYYLVTLLYLICAIVLPQFVIDDYDQYTKHEVRVMLIIVTIILIFICLFYSYTWIVIFRAYQFMRDEIEPNKFGVRTTVYQQPEGGYPMPVYQQQYYPNQQQPQQQQYYPNQPYSYGQQQQPYQPQFTYSPQQTHPSPLYDQTLRNETVEMQEIDLTTNRQRTHTYDDPISIEEDIKLQTRQNPHQQGVPFPEAQNPHKYDEPPKLEDGEKKRQRPSIKGARRSGLKTAVIMEALLLKTVFRFEVFYLQFYILQITFALLHLRLYIFIYGLNMIGHTFSIAIPAVFSCGLRFTVVNLQFYALKLCTYGLAFEFFIFAIFFLLAFVMLINKSYRV